MKKFIVALFLSLMFWTSSLWAASQFAGVYSGSLDGDISSSWIGIVEADRHVRIMMFSESIEIFDTAQGSYVDDSGNLLALSSDGNIFMKLKIDSSGDVQGTWNSVMYGQGGISGALHSPDRSLGGSYSGQISGNDSGNVDIAVKSTGLLTGQGYSENAGDFIFDGAVDSTGKFLGASEFSAVYGMISNSTMTAVWSSDGLNYGGTISAPKEVGLAGDYEYYLPVFKPNPENWTGLGISNLSNTDTANVSVNIYSSDGIKLAEETQQIVAAGQASFVVGKNLNDEGWIKITSDQNLAGLTFLGQYINDMPDYFLADVPFSKTASKSLIIPHVAQNVTWDTTIYIANTEALSSTVTLTYYAKDSTPVIPYTVNISGYGTRQIPVSAVGASTDIRGGYVSISSSRNIAAFAIYNNVKTGNYSFAGINAVDISELE